MKKLGLDLTEPLRLRPAMSEDAEAHREVVRQLFYLITIAAEEAATLAVEGQSRRFSPDHARASADNLREMGTRIEILSSAITELI
ncbi:hypothetical protein MNQ96_11575 [Sphingopyxis granuli]|uniref:hypothetical protein n=1 Tax=Sphingopyxis granuli TaxID=267128 RepID=UPI001F53C543|nr:hypothetical protein [Sphingopyxis granuli]UNK78223.1 hypothetical protein MNQ96_11575 [Sphingopyxis granuli]